MTPACEGQQQVRTQVRTHARACTCVSKHVPHPTVLDGAAPATCGHAIGTQGTMGRWAPAALVLALQLKGRAGARARLGPLRSSGIVRPSHSECYSECGAWSRSLPPLMSAPPSLRGAYLPHTRAARCAVLRGDSPAAPPGLRGERRTGCSYAGRRCSAVLAGAGGCWAADALRRRCLGQHEPDDGVDGEEQSEPAHVPEREGVPQVHDAVEHVQRLHDAGGIQRWCAVASASGRALRAHWCPAE